MTPRPKWLDVLLAVLTIRAKYILRFDDIAPNMNWRGFLRIKQACDEAGVKPLLGVIPDNKDPRLLRYPRTPVPFFSEMRRLQDAGWAIAQHGFQHQYVTRSGGLLNLASKSEFAGLPLESQRRKIQSGKALLEARGIKTETFMAPSHSFDEHTLSALVDLGFTNVTDGLSLWPYHESGLLFVPQLFGKPKPMPFGLFTFCLHVNTMTATETLRVARFIREHAEDFISFNDAGVFASANSIHRSIGSAIAKALQLRARAKARRLSGNTPDASRLTSTVVPHGLD